jgi:hypothetical protein
MTWMIWGTPIAEYIHMILLAIEDIWKLWSTMSTTCQHNHYNIYVIYILYIKYNIYIYYYICGQIIRNSLTWIFRPLIWVWFPYTFTMIPSFDRAQASVVMKFSQGLKPSTDRILILSHESLILVNKFPKSEIFHVYFGLLILEVGTDHIYIYMEYPRLIPSIIYE